MGPLVITEVRVQNFQNIQDSGWVPMEQVTALVGRNESGKTAFLKALHKFNAANGETYDPQRDFPRDRYTRDFRPEHASRWPVCSVRYKVDSAFAEELQKTHELDVLITFAEFTRDYSNKLTWDVSPDITDDPVLSMELNTALERFQSAARRLDSEVPEQQEQDQKTREKLLATATALQDAINNIPQLRCPEGTKLLTQARDQVNKLSNPLTASIVEEFVSVANRLLQRATSPSKVDAVYGALSKKLPVFIYFENYGVLDSAIYLPDFLEAQKRNPNDPKVRTVAAMFRHVNLSPEEISSLGIEQVTAARIAKQPVTDEMIAQEERQKEARAIKLNAASIDLTKRFSEWWKQRRHKIRHHADGQYFRIWVADDRRPDVEIELESRSKGFQWFFSFYLIFLVESEDFHKDAVLLLDEPGLHLHPTAQQELISFFEELSDKNQLIYTTHSPFLIDGEHLERVRPVTETADGNSKIAIGYWPEDRDTIFPLQAAAGYAMVQALFKNKKNVLVEGMGDFYLIYGLSTLCAAAGKDSLSSDVYVTPCGGARMVGPLASLFLGQKIRPLVLLDGDEQGRVRKAILLKELYSGHEKLVLLLSDVLAVRECEIEDVVGEGEVLPVVNRLLGATLSLDPTTAGQKSLPDRIQDAAQEAGITLPEGWKPEVARRLTARWATSDARSVDSKMLDRAARLLNELNRRFT